MYLIMEDVFIKKYTVEVGNIKSIGNASMYQLLVQTLILPMENASIALIACIS